MDRWQSGGEGRTQASRRRDLRCERPTADAQSKVRRIAGSGRAQTPASSLAECVSNYHKRCTNSNIVFISIEIDSNFFYFTHSKLLTSTSVSVSKSFQFIFYDMQLGK